ncbi:MAG: EAL domain-containing protein [Aeromonadaceae bacterium]|nr:EAL domain-containing protein [Aeromonadaceae bacterium]
MLLELIKGVALLLALCLLYGLLLRGRLGRLGRHGRQLLTGLLFGSLCIVGMSTPITLAGSGVIFDARSVILSMAGLFGGPLVALLAGSMAALFRLWLGGVGAPVGVCVILLSVLAGLLYRLACQRKWLSLGFGSLVLFGLGLHLLVLYLFTFLPTEAAQLIHSLFGLEFLLVFALATALLGRLLQDARQRRRTELALARSQRQLKAVVHAMPDLLFVLNDEGRYLEMLTHEEAHLVRSRSELLGKRIQDVFAPEQATALMSVLQRTLRQGPQCHEYQIAIQGGQRRWFEGRTHVLGRYRGHRNCIVWLARDITERKEREEQIANLAFYDPLTGLPNRRLLRERLGQCLKESQRTGQYGALLFFDLDHFKIINDTLGHDVGDQLLRQVAERLQRGVRQVDTVARLGGDEFVVLLVGLDGQRVAAANQCRWVAEKLLGELGRPYPLAGQDHYSSVSMGMVLFLGEEHSAETLHRHADMALYQAKAAGRNTYRFYDETMQVAIKQRVSLESALRQGLQLRQFQPFYQPQVNAEGWVVGAEVLVRWLHPQRGMVSPAEFIPLAEETGLIIPLAEQLLAQVCEQLVAWAQLPGFADLSLAVNISARQVRQEDFVERIIAQVRHSGANPQRLKLELTESLLLHDMADMIRKMRALKAFGIGFSLDDFGTGYSSLSYLKRLPLEQLKIDQSFVRDLLTDPNDAAIARTIIALADSLGLSVIAEGVEQQSQRLFLARQGCHIYQGFLFGRPCPVDIFMAALQLDPQGRLILKQA